MKKSFKLSVIAITLSAIMFLRAIPFEVLNVFAEVVADVFTKSEETKEIDSSLMSDVGNIGGGYIIQENVEKRTANTKEFLMSDDTIMVQQFVEPVHYLENGEYKEIDNSLIEETIAGKKVYKNKANAFNVQFYNEQGTVVEIEEDGYGFQFSYKTKSRQSIKEEITNAGKLEKVDYTEKEYTRPNLVAIPSGQIKYNSTVADTDIVHMVKNSKVSNDIIINEKQERYYYLFELQSKNLTFKQNEDGSVSAINEVGQTKFVMPLPYMVDANGEYSDAVTYKLTEKEGQVALSLTADAEWVNEKAEFPIKIAPEIKSAKTQSLTFASVTESGDTITNTDEVYIGKKNGAEKSDLFLNFKLPEVSSYYHLLGASINLEYQTQGMTLFDSKDLQYDVYLAESTNNLSAISYENKPNNIQNLNRIQKNAQLATKSASYESGIINTNIIENETITIGIETLAETSGDSYIVMLTTGERTSLLSWYEVVIGLEDSYNMESFEIEGASTYVNNGTGKQTGVFDLISVNTLSDIPLSVSLIYNDDYDKVLEDLGKSSIVGNNMKLNFQQFMLSCGNVFKLIDADGSISTFTSTVTDGIYYSKEKKLYYNSTNKTLYDTVGNKTYFDSAGRLKKIISDNNPTEYIEVIYGTTASDKITAINYYANSVLKYTISFLYNGEKITSATTNADSLNSLEMELVYNNENLVGIKNKTDNSVGVQILSFDYHLTGSSERFGKLISVFNNQKRGISFQREETAVIFQVDYIEAANNASSGRCVASTKFDYDGACTEILYYEYSVLKNSRYVSFNNSQKTISEWQQDDSGVISVSTTNNWRNEETIAAQEYTETTSSYYYSAQNFTSESLVANGYITKTIKPSMLGVSYHENYGCAVIFQVIVSDSEENFNAGLNLSVLIGNAVEENIILEQGGNTFVCIPCSYYMEDKYVLISNNGTRDVAIANFGYVIVDKVEETRTWDSSIEAHRIFAMQTNSTSGNYSRTTYDSKQRVDEVVTRKIAANSLQQTISYAYYDEATATALQKGKIKSVTTTDENDTLVEKTEYSYTGSWSNYTETSIVTKGDLKLRTRNNINRASLPYVITQKDENNTETKAYYTAVSGDLRLTKTTYGNTREEYGYNALGQVTNINVYEGASDTPIFSQSDNYDANGMYVGSTYAGETYTYGYDDTGYVTSINKNGQTENLIDYTYYGNGNALYSNRLGQKTYANGNVENYTYAEVTEAGQSIHKTRVSHQNTANGSVQGEYVYKYNTNDAMIGQEYWIGNKLQVGYDYGDIGNLSRSTLKINGLNYYFTYTTNYDVMNKRVKSAELCSLIGCYNKEYRNLKYEYNNDGQVSGMTYHYFDGVYTYDKHGRLATRETSDYDTVENERYVYKTYVEDGVTYSTNFLSMIDDQTYRNHDRTASYDANGYVTGISYNGDTYAYEYDAAGRLTKETKNNRMATTYTYDEYNNVQISGLTYTNGVLTKINGSTISYDEMGNPTRYKGNYFYWTQGRKLESGSMDGKNFSYSYDGNGMRYKKTVDGQTTEYYYNGSQLLMEIRGGERIYYVYDVTGVAGLFYQDNLYIFEKNTLGDVVAILDDMGNIVGSYEYNAWGEITSQDGAIANINPFRYRGYYYDVETGFYYLQTRYYDPTICRFINADNYELVSTLGSVPGQLNMYAYCNNNPIMYTDETGAFAISLTMLGLIIGAVIGATAGGIIAYNIAEEQGATGWELVGWTALGIVGGGIVGGAIGAGIGALATKLTGVVGLSITKNSVVAIKGTTILGHNPSYVEIAKQMKAGYYRISDPLYNALKSKGVEWANNLQYLKDANTLGSKFVLSPDYVVLQTGTLWKEIQYLAARGIPWIMY